MTLERERKLMQFAFTLDQTTMEEPMSLETTTSQRKEFSQRRSPFRTVMRRLLLVRFLEDQV